MIETKNSDRGYTGSAGTVKCRVALPVRSGNMVSALQNQTDLQFQSHKMFYGNVTHMITLGYMLCNFDSSYMSHNNVG